MRQNKGIFFDILLLDVIIELRPLSECNDFTDSATALFAHHVQKKIVKRKQDKRPIKSRLSDINRKNVNMNKCITKVENAPADYSIISAEG